MNKTLFRVLLLSLCLCGAVSAQIPSTIIDPLSKGYTAQSVQRTYALSMHQLNPSVLFSADANGLKFDLADSTLYGRIHYGPADFDFVNSDYLEPRFRSRSDVKKGKGLLEIASVLPRGVALEREPLDHVRHVWLPLSSSCASRTACR